MESEGIYSKVLHGDARQVNFMVNIKRKKIMVTQVPMGFTLRVPYENSLLEIVISFAVMAFNR